MAYSVDYTRLQAVAGKAVGRPDLAALDDWELSEVRAAGNKAVDRVAQMRRWPHLIVDLSLALIAADSFVLLPSDWERFEEQDPLQFWGSTGIGPLRFIAADSIRNRRQAGTVSGYPQLAAIGAVIATGATAGRTKLELWPGSDAVYTIIGTYRRKPAAMAAGSDTPDLPTQLHAALETATAIETLLGFNRRAEAMEIMGVLDRQVDDAARLLLPQTIGVATPLCDVSRRRGRGYPRGRNMTLDPGYFA